MQDTFVKFSVHLVDGNGEIYYECTMDDHSIWNYNPKTKEWIVIKPSDSELSKLFKERT